MDKDYPNSIRIKTKRLFSEDIMFFDVGKYTVDVKSDMIVLDFDQKVLFGKALRHKTLYLTKDNLMALLIRKRLNKEEIIK